MKQSGPWGLTVLAMFGVGVMPLAGLARPLINLFFAPPTFVVRGCDLVYHLGFVVGEFSDELSIDTAQLTPVIENHIRVPLGQQ